MKLNRFFDHTLLAPDATPAQIRTLCQQAEAYDFYSVCVNSSNVPLAADFLSDSNVLITAVAGFPLGAATTNVKAYEAEEACRSGACEIDMVINLGRFKGGDYDYVKKDIAAVAEAASEYGASIKVILETALLTDEEILTACGLADEAGAAFVKTSTGFCAGGATVHAVALMKKAVAGRMGVKASGGIRTLKDVRAMIAAGADRIGASASVEIMKEAVRESK